MKPRTLVLLLALTFGLGGFIFFFERELPSTDERKKLDKQVLALKAEEVQAVEISWGDQKIRLEKVETPKKDDEDEAIATESGDSESGYWQLKAPYDVRADSVAAAGLARRLAELQQERKFDDFDPAAFGLATPRGRVQVVGKKGTFELAIGDDLPVAGTGVVGFAKSAFQVANFADLIEQLRRPAGDWRDKKLFHAERALVERLTLEEGGRRTLLARRGEGETFWIESPFADLADRDLVSGLLTDLVGLEAATFLEPQTAFVASGRKLEAQVKGLEKPMVIELGALEADQVMARVDGQLVKLPATRFQEALDRAVEDWRSKAWTTIQVFQVENALFEKGNRLEVKRDGGDWRRGEDKVEYTVVSDALYPLSEVRAEQIIDRQSAAAAGHDLKTPRLEITLKSTGIEEKLKVYPAVAGLAAATASTREAVLLLPDAKILELEAKIEALRVATPAKEQAPETTPQPGPDDSEGDEG
jgi:Domain of unknown function (DUF4340)